MSDERPKRIELTVSDELWDRIDAARGFEPRASFVKRALESALGEVNPSQVGRGPSQVAKPQESSRAPVANVLGSPVRKVPSLKDTWGR